MYLFFFIIVGVGLILLVLQQQGKLPFAQAGQKLPPVERSIFNLEIGDIVQYQGVDWFVEGKLIYSTGSDTWFEYMLQENDNICWLSVEEDDVVEVALLQEVDVPSITSTPPPRTITYLDNEYRLVGKGTAKMMRLGNTLNRQEQSCSYFDYKTNSYHRLSVEVWGEDLEVTAGRKINPRMLTLLPGDGSKVYS